MYPLEYQTFGRKNEPKKKICRGGSVISISSRKKLLKDLYLISGALIAELDLDE